MRLALFDEYRLGVVSGDQQTITDVTDSLPWPYDPDSLSAGWWRRFCRDFIAIRPRLSGGVTRKLDDVRLRAPVLNPSKVIGVAINYPDHLTEMREAVMPRTGTDQSKWLLEFDIFLKAPSSIVGPADAVRLPDSVLRVPSKEIHHECELAIVIGVGGSRIAAATAFEHVLGYSIGLDITERGTGDRSRRKSWDTFTPLGPWITTVDSVVDPGDLEIRLEIDGQIKQQANTRDMIVGIPGIIAYASSVMRLEPGDVILTGAPPGVGAIHAGDVIDAQISQLGRLQIPVMTDSTSDGPNRIGTARKGELV